MINFSEATAIALHSMIYIATRNDRVVSLTEIANTFSISSNHLSKILQRLVKAGYLESSKGPNGGFKIIADKMDTNFMEIFETIEGKYIEKSCLFTAKTEGCTNCIMGGLIPKINKELVDYMTSHKITDFVL